jgi:hypothetical protein
MQIAGFRVRPIDGADGKNSAQKTARGRRAVQFAEKCYFKDC